MIDKTFKNRQALKQHKRGFTIVELLVVVIVIAILATITIVAYNGIQKRAEAASAQSLASKTARKIQVYFAENDTLPSTAADIGLNAADDVQYKVNNSTSPQTFCATATVGKTSYFVNSTQGIPAPGGCDGHGRDGVAAISNYARNPSFESGISPWGWTNRNGYTGGITTAQAHSGTSSFYITAPSTVNDSYIEGMSIATSVPMGTYSMKMWVYLTASGTTAFDRNIWFFCSGGTCSANQSVSYNQSLLNQWQPVTATLTVTSAQSNIWMRLYAPTGGTAYFDSIMITSGPTPLDYKDGNSPNWAWTDAVNNSVSTGPAN